MNEYQAILFLHVVGFAYWLGGDLGVFHSSYWLADRDNPPAVRIAAAKILFWLDQVPRMLMTMMLPLGLHLAYLRELLPISATGMLLIWIACFGWLGLVVYLHVAKPSATKQFMTRFDFWFRLVLTLVLIGIGLSSLIADLPGTPYWVAWKIAIYGWLVGAGLLVRVQLREFGPAFAKLASGDATAADDEAVTRGIEGTRPYVVTIWIGLLASTALGLHLI